jgi:hypothetical protein
MGAYFIFIVALRSGVKARRARRPLGPERYMMAEFRATWNLPKPWWQLQVAATSWLESLSLAPQA